MIAKINIRKLSISSAELSFHGRGLRAAGPRPRFGRGQHAATARRCGPPQAEGWGRTPRGDRGSGRGGGAVDVPRRVRRPAGRVRPRGARPPPTPALPPCLGPTAHGPTPPLWEPVQEPGLEGVAQRLGAEAPLPAVLLHPGQLPVRRARPGGPRREAPGRGAAGQRGAALVGRAAPVGAV